MFVLFVCTVSVLLSPSLKQFVKKICVAPETLTVADYALKGYSFGHDEKCHIALLAMEAHRQATLLYALHSVMKYMSST